MSPDISLFITVTLTSNCESDNTGTTTPFFQNDADILHISQTPAFILHLAPYHSMFLKIYKG